MKVFRELRILVNGLALPECVRLLEQHASGGWQRAAEREQRLRALTPWREGPFCFLFPGNRDNAAALLGLVGKPPDRLEVANIIAEWKGDLSVEEYNGLLEHFAEHVATRAVAASGGRIRLEMTPATVRLEELIPAPVVDKLRRFSAAANKLGASHPEDLKRWVDFLTEMHRQGDGLSPQLLRRWLEEESWPDYTASQLVSEYEFANELLAAYDRKGT